MKEIPLTKGYVALVDDEDFEMLSKLPWRVVLKKRHRGLCGYALTHIGPRTISMHRLLLGIKGIDHIDRDGLNNQRGNLRVCTNQQNQYNRAKTPGNFTSKFKGVNWSKDMKKWEAQIRDGKKTIRIGFFKEETDAAQAYNFVALEMRGEFAYLNQVQP